ncbi:MAG TPA: hypothetical protein VHN55_09935 [Sphingomicrobium sp.]|nr:hypothetical protein [Sphingomicrobium sp.]
MTETRGEDRAQTAKRNDDSDIIDAAADEAVAGGAHQQGREGGNLQADLATQAERRRATDPNAHESVKKGDHVAHGQGETPPHPATEVVSDRD